MITLKSGVPNIPLVGFLVTIFVLIADWMFVHEFTNPECVIYIGVVPMMILSICFLIFGLIMFLIDSGGPYNGK